MALLHSLEDWLPSAIAYERAGNAAASFLLLEDIQWVITPSLVLDPEEVIGHALSNPCAMCGILAPPERVQAAVRAWLRTSATEAHRLARRVVEAEPRGELLACEMLDAPFGMAAAAGLAGRAA